MRYLVLIFVIITSLHSLAETLPVNPFTGKEYEKISFGEFKNYSRRGTHYKWRYITIYNLIEVQRVIQDLPRFEENCHDDGDRVASWEYSKTFTREINTGAKLSVLGFVDLDFGGAMSKEYTFGITRWIQAQAGIQAIHTPILKTKKMIGITYIQRYFEQANKYEAIALKNPDFLVTQLDPTFMAHREIIGECI